MMQNHSHVDVAQNVLHILASWSSISSSGTMKALGSHVTSVRSSHLKECMSVVWDCSENCATFFVQCGVLYICWILICISLGWVFRLHRMHEMQTVVIDVCGVCLSGLPIHQSVCVTWCAQCVWGYSVQSLPNYFGLLLSHCCSNKFAFVSFFIEICQNFCTSKWHSSIMYKILKQFTIVTLEVLSVHCSTLGVRYFLTASAL